MSTNQVPQLHESRFSYASLIKRASLDKSDRRHSFRVPELPRIPSQIEESEESDASTCSSLSTISPAGSGKTELRKNAGKGKGGKTSGYLLSLAAQAAEKQLREQAMAAYPNEHFHEPVDHFAVDREDADSDGEGVGLLSRSATCPAPGGSSDSAAPSSRRESHAGWDAAEMRRHKEDLERQRQELQDKDQSPCLWQKQSVREPTKEHHHGDHHQHHQHHHHHHHQHDHRHDHHQHKRQSTRPKQPAALPNMIGGHQKDDQMNPMHKAASPPMAGQNLTFPKCQSPRQTRLDVGQYPGAPSRLGAPRSRDHSGLWTPGSGGSDRTPKAACGWACARPLLRNLMVPL